MIFIIALLVLLILDIFMIALLVLLLLDIFMIALLDLLLFIYVNCMLFALN